MKKIMAFIFACIISLFSIYNVKAEDYVAKIGETNYATLEEAIKAADDSSIINLLGEGTLSFNPNKSLTFVGNGKISVKGSKPWNSYRGVLTLKGSGVTFEWEDDTNSWLMMALSGTINIEDGATMRFKFNSNSTATRNAIYMNAGSVINVKNGSHLEIIAETTTNAKGQGIQLDAKNKSFINVMGGSTFLIDGTNRGYVNSPEIYVKDSKFTVRNCTSNGSNGGKFTAINSEITFYNNGGHGLSATTLDVEKSNVTTNKNKFYGISIGSKMSVDSTSTIISNENGYGYTGGALRIATSSATGYFDAGAKVTFTNNHRNALENYGTTVFEDGVELSITGNKDPKNGAGVFNGKDGNLTLPINAVIMNNQSTELGGGVYNKGLVIIPNSVKLYNNHAGNAGDDIYNNGTITFGIVGTDWYLDGKPDCEDLINGWYDDSTPYEINDGTIMGGRWNAHSENNHIELVNSGKYEGIIAIKAAHNLEGKVIVHYVDEEGSALLEDKILTGYEDDSYKTTPEDIEGYTLINTIGNETGKYTSSKTIEVTYVYQFTKGQGSVEEPVINPPVEEPPHTSVNTSIYTLVLLVNVLGISVLLKKREN